MENALRATVFFVHRQKNNVQKTSIMNTLLALLIVAIVFGLIWWIVDSSPLTPTWKNIVKIIVALIAIVYLVTRFLGVHVQ